MGLVPSASHNQREVAGESAEALRQAFAHFRARDEDEHTRIDAKIPADEALPLIRAWMRVEAELLLQDAEHLTEPGVKVRTPDERRTAAFVALTGRLVHSADLKEEA